MYTKENLFTLSPLFVSKSNERYLFQNIETEHDSITPPLKYYYDWFAHRELFKKELQDSVDHLSTSVNNAWHQLLVEKCQKENISWNDKGYNLPVEGQYSPHTYFAKFKQPLPKVSTPEEDALYRAFLEDGIIMASGVDLQTQLELHRQNKCSPSGRYMFDIDKRPLKFCGINSPEKATLDEIIKETN